MLSPFFRTACVMINARVHQFAHVAASSLQNTGYNIAMLSPQLSTSQPHQSNAWRKSIICHAAPRHRFSSPRSLLPLRLPFARFLHKQSREEDDECDSTARATTSAATIAELEDGDQLKRELHSLNVAIGANILIFVAKAWVHMVTGSSSILAEALHSVADILNQFLLRIGVLKSLQGPTTEFPYGYLRDRFVWSLISAVGIFFLGAGGPICTGLISGGEQALLCFMVSTLSRRTTTWKEYSGLIWGYSLYVAVKNIQVGAQARKMGFFDYVKSGVDPTTVAVLMEDGGALMGLAIAGLCTALAHYTGSAMWDAAGSIGIGLLLGAIATFLVGKNRQLLIGRSMNPREVEEVMNLLRRDPAVNYVLDTKTEEIGPRIFRFKAEVAWDGTALSGRYLERVGRERLVERLKKALQDPDPAAIDRVLKSYGKGIISAVGAEVDRIEAEIQSMNPGIRYVDLETDRGRSKFGPLSSSDGDFDPGRSATRLLAEAVCLLVIRIRMLVTLLAL